MVTEVLSSSRQLYKKQENLFWLNTGCVTIATYKRKEEMATVVLSSRGQSYSKAEKPISNHNNYKYKTFQNV